MKFSKSSRKDIEATEDLTKTKIERDYQKSLAIDCAEQCIKGGIGIAELSAKLAAMESELAELRAYKEAAESQKPDCWRITHPSFCGIVTDKKEIAEDPFYSGCVFPLYANPVPADHAEKNLEMVSQRITEQDAMSILLEWDAYRAERSASGVTPAHFKKWLYLVGRDLLNKLNADREKVPAVAVPDAIQLLQRDELEELLSEYSFDIGEDYSKAADAILSRYTLEHSHDNQ